MTISEKIVNKMNVAAFNSNEDAEKIEDSYPTEDDYKNTIGYNLAHGWVPNPAKFTEEEIQYIISLEWDVNRAMLIEMIDKLR